MEILSRLCFYSVNILLLFFGSTERSNGALIFSRPVSRMSTKQHLYLSNGNPNDYLSNGRCDLKDYVEDNLVHHSIIGGGNGVFDYRSSLLCIYDTRNRCIQNYRGSLPKAFVLSCSTKMNMSAEVTGLAIDWLSNLCYWSDATFRRIGVVETTSFKYWKPVVDTELTSPQDVVVYPKLSYLFWIDGGNNPKIERLDLVNNIRMVIVSKDTLIQPMNLVIDFTAERLIWLDSRASRVGSINFDGSNPSFWDQSMFQHIAGIVLYKEYIIFISDEKTNRTGFAYNYTQREYLCNATHYYLTEDTHVRAIDDTLDSLVKSPCSSGNGGCEHFCTATNTTSVICSCAIGFLLDSNETSCIEPLRDNFLLVSDGNTGNILQVDLRNGDVVSLRNLSRINPYAMAYDPKSEIIYFINNYVWLRSKTFVEINGRHLISGKLLTERQYTLPGEGHLTGLVIDLDNELLYFSVECESDFCRSYVFENTSRSGILNVSLSLEKPNVLFSDDQTEQVAIALDVRNRLMFWSQCGSQRKSIEQAPIENLRNHKSIVSDLDNCSTAIAIDSLGSTLYWGDKSGNLYRINLNGGGKVLIHEDRGAMYSGLALDDNYLYISDSSKSAIQKLDRKSNKVVSMTSVFMKPNGITLYNSTIYQVIRKRVTPGQDLNSEDRQNAFGIAVLVCVSTILVALFATIGFIIARKQRTEAINQPTTYESTLGFPGSSVYDEEHYDTIDLNAHYDTIDFKAISTEGYYELPTSNDSDVGQLKPTNLKDCEGEPNYDYIAEI